MSRSSSPIPATQKKALFSINDIESQIALFHRYLSESDKSLLMKEANQFLNGFGSYKKIKSSYEQYEYFCNQIERILLTSKQQQKNQFMFKERVYEALAVAACVGAIGAMISGTIFLMVTFPLFLALSFPFGLIGLGLLIWGAVAGTIAALGAIEQDIDRKLPKLNQDIDNGDRAYTGLLGFFGSKNSQSARVDEPVWVDAPVAAI